MQHMKIQWIFYSTQDLSKKGSRDCKIDRGAEIKELLWTVTKQGQRTKKVRFRAELMGERGGGSEIWFTVECITSWTNWRNLQSSVCQQSPFANLRAIHFWKTQVKSSARLNRAVPLIAMGLFQFTHWWSDLEFFLVKGSQTPLFYPKCPQLLSLSFSLHFALSYIYTNNDKTDCSTQHFSIQLIYSKQLRELSEIWGVRKTELASS